MSTDADRIPADQDWLEHPYTRELVKNARGDIADLRALLFDRALGSSDPVVREAAARVATAESILDVLERGIFKNGEQSNGSG